MNLKRFILLVAIIVIAAIDIVMCWNTYQYYRAKDEVEDTEAKVRILEKADKIYPLNELVLYELGKAYYDLGINSLENQTLRDKYFQKSIEDFTRSLRINPASVFTHFHFAQSLLYMRYISPSININPYDEFKKSALLTGHHSEIFYEVGKILFSRWNELSEEERNFSVELLRNLIIKGDKEKLQDIMHIWDLNVKDYKAMERILAEDSNVYRMYAQFLGEMSLSLEKRQEFLAKAEFLEFRKAREIYDSALGNFQYYRQENSSRQFKSCLDKLKRINFYQNLIGKEYISPIEFNNLYKSVNLNLAKCLIEEDRMLNEVETYLRAYLEMEDKIGEVGELESYLNTREIIGETLEAKFNDLKQLSFQILLYFKQNRYRDIVRIGRLFHQSLIVVPEESKDDYVKVLQLMGGSFQKIDYIYDSGEFYQKAIEADPDNLETLMRMRQNYERLNEDEKIQEIDARIEELLAPKEIIPVKISINKGRKFSRNLIFVGKRISLQLYYESPSEGIPPLISVFFNGQIVWEDYLKEEILTIPLETKVGQNSLVISPLNRSINLAKITYQ